MKVGGHYAENSEPQQMAARLYQPELGEALHRSRRMTTSRLAVADYGCADGGSAWFVDAVLSDRQSGCKVDFFFVDLPSNDAVQLQQTICERIGINDLVEFRYQAGSFYSQIWPTSSIDIALTSTAVHNLSVIPCKLENKCHWLNCSDDQASRHWAEQASIDWENFLRARAGELRPGGRLIVTSLAFDPERSHPEAPLYALLDEAILRVTSSKHICLREYFRTKEELCPDIAAHYKLRCLSQRWIELQLPFRGLECEPEKFATKVEQQSRSWMESQFCSAGFTEPEIDSVFTEFRKLLLHKASKHLVGAELSHIDSLYCVTAFERLTDISAGSCFAYAL